MNSKTETSPVQNLNAINEVLTDLQNRGFTYLFKLKDACISCKDYNIAFNEFDILEVHSVKTSSGKNYVLYAIKCDNYDIKGVIINHYETYSHSFTSVCMNKILNNTEIKLHTIPGCD